MKITIDTDILEKENLSLGETLVLLLSYYNVDTQKEMASLYEKGIADRNLFENIPPVLSDNAKVFVNKLLVNSDRNVQNSNLEFLDIAQAMYALYPSGKRPGKNYSWKSSAKVLAERLKTLVKRYNFTFTKEEAVAVTQEYLNSFGGDYTRMKMLDYFIWKDDKANNGFTSDFMTLIENKRDNETSN